MTKKDQDLKKIYDDFLEFLIKKLVQYEDSQLIASTMIAQALRLYKSTLTDKEYREMMNTVIKTSRTTGRRLALRPQRCAVARRRPAAMIAPESWGIRKDVS